MSTPSLLETRHLRLVAAIAAHGSLARASSEVHLTQSALSHQLAGLERKLGVSLFHRLGKRMAPTAAGAALIEASGDLLARLAQVEDETRRMGRGQPSLLRISTECYTSYHWLPTLLRSFGRQFPNVDLQIVAEATRNPIRALLDGQIDLAIVNSAQPHAHLAALPLFDDEQVVLMHPEHPLARRSYLDAEDFADQHVIMYQVPPRETSLFRDVLEPADVVPRKVSKIQLTEAIIEMVRANLGIAVLARWAVAPYAADGSLHLARCTASGIRRQWSAVVLKDLASALHVREFARLLARGPAVLEMRAGVE